MQQVHGMDAPLLAESIDPPDALFEANRIPRHFQIDDQATAVVQVEALTGGVGGDEHVQIAALELLHCLLPHGGRYAAVDRGEPEGRRQRVDRR
ncbi:MAG: hypothetical protein Q8N52_09175, partial [Acidobacteriota bacterium]|nr:hypothetical protein [Acidobacteriota bacterium]